MEFEEFKESIRSKRTQGKVRGSWGVYDAYKYIRKNGWMNIGRPVKEHEFYSIIRRVNDLLAAEIVQGNTIRFPARMGKLELRKKKREVKMVDGRLKIDYPIDWDKTLHLWYEDKEAHQQKILVRRQEPYTYMVKYCRHEANYENKSFYEFSLNRFVKIALKEEIHAGRTDSIY